MNGDSSLSDWHLDKGCWLVNILLLLQNIILFMCITYPVPWLTSGHVVWQNGKECFVFWRCKMLCSVCVRAVISGFSYLI